MTIHNGAGDATPDNLLRNFLLNSGSFFGAGDNIIVHEDQMLDYSPETVVISLQIGSLNNREVDSFKVHLFLMLKQKMSLHFFDNVAIISYVHLPRLHGCFLFLDGCSCCGCFICEAQLFFDSLAREWLDGTLLAAI